MALGVTQTLPEERHSFSREYIEDRICMALGGRVAEEVVFGQRTTGAANDLEVDHRPGPPHGAGVGHERPHRADGLAEPAARLPRRGPHDRRARLQRRHRPPGRRGGRRASCGSRRTGPASCCEAPARPRPGGRGAARDARRSTGPRWSSWCRRVWVRSPATAAAPTPDGPSPRASRRRRAAVPTDAGVSCRSADRGEVRATSPAGGPRPRRPTGRSR